MTKRFMLTNTSIAGQWRCIDFQTQISCVFEKHNFNDTQKFDASEAKVTDAQELSKASKEMGEWLFENHYNIIMPPVEEKLLGRMLLGKRISQLRAERGLSQADLASLCGMEASSISRLENGRFGVGVDILNKVAKALGCRIDLIEI